MGSNMKKALSAKIRMATSTTVVAECQCGIVRMEIDFPAFWAWHDHSMSSRRAHGAAYATYVGSWRSRFRVTQGAQKITRFEDPAAGTVRSFCSRCGTPLYNERARSPHMVNVSRALFQSRTGRRALGAVEGISRRRLGALKTQEAAAVRRRILETRYASAKTRAARTTKSAIRPYTAACQWGAST